MARLFIDGFESGELGLYTLHGAPPPSIVTASTYGMVGNYCAKVVKDTYFAKVLPAPQSVIYMAFKCMIDHGSAQITFLDSGGTAVARLNMQCDASPVTLYRGTNTSLATAAGLSTDTVYLVEIYYRPLNTNGQFSVKINGVDYISVAVTGVDTTAGLENVAQIQFLASNTGGITYFDDLVIDDADWIGQTYIEGIVPSGAGTTTQWDPSTGANYTCVDELPASDTDYISTNTTNKIDTYEMGNLTSEIGTIKCIQVQTRSLYEGAPTPTHQQLVVRSGGTDYPSADKTIGTVAAGISHIWETNPADDAAWEEADVNAIEAGVKATA